MRGEGRARKISASLIWRGVDHITRAAASERQAIQMRIDENR